MTTLEHALRIAVLVAWAPAIYLGARSIPGKRSGDAMRIGCFLVALFVIGFNLRWLTGVQESEGVIVGLLLLTIATGAYTFFAMMAYGRGPSR